MQNVGGLSAWRWLFILEGLPSVVCSVSDSFSVYPDFQRLLPWLSPEERPMATTAWLLKVRMLETATSVGLRQSDLDGLASLWTLPCE